MSDPAQIIVCINGVHVAVPPATTVAAAILIAGAPIRTSVSGQPRGPLCGMGMCFECRATINGVPHQRSCQIICADQMEVRVD